MFPCVSVLIVGADFKGKFLQEQMLKALIAKRETIRSFGSLLEALIACSIPVVIGFLAGFVLGWMGTTAITIRIQYTYKSIYIYILSIYLF